MEWVVASDLDRERWRRLREFANLDFARAAIERRHGAANTNSARSNFRKQALQLRMSLLQAEEYLGAARVSTPYTSPTHLYYGMVALASAVMLLLGDGTRSFDYLRRDPRNMHHGLDFSLNTNATNAEQGLNILEEARVEVARRGHFHAWHSVLPATEPCYALVREHDGTGTNTYIDEIGAENTALTDELVGRKFTLLRLMRNLPDLANDLRRYGAGAVSTRANYELDLRRSGGKGAGMMKHTWRLHDAVTVANLMLILERFRFPPDATEHVEVTDPISTPSCIIKASMPDTVAYPMEWPSARYTSDLRTFFYAEHIDTHEFTDFYTAAFGLSMLARYYPDVWRACLESQCLASKLIESFVTTALDRAPQIALSLLSGWLVVISTNRAPWHD